MTTSTLEPTKTPLRKLRERRKLRLQDVQQATGIDTGNLSRIEQGTQRCSIERAEKLVEFYGERSINVLQIMYPDRYNGASRT